MKQYLLPLSVLLLMPAAVQATLVQGPQFSGNIALEIAGAATGNPPAGTPATGSLTLSNVLGPPLKATFYANTVNTAGQPLDLKLDQAPVPTTTPIAPSVVPFASDAANSVATLFAYQWDVSNIISTQGAGIYNFDVGSNGNGNQISGVALAVVYNDPSAPNSQITFIEGMETVAENGTAETESATFTGLIAGPTQISIFTVSDDNAGTGEQIFYNTVDIDGGQSIDQNLGLNASLLQLSATSVSGNNTLAIQSSTSPVDTFGWMLAIADVQQASVIPEPSAFVLAALGLLSLGWIFQRRKESCVTWRNAGDESIAACRRSSAEMAIES